MRNSDSEDVTKSKDAPDHAADDAGDGHSFAAAFYAALADLVVADDAEDDREHRWDDGAERGEADDAEDQRRDAEAVARSAGFERRAFHREGHAAALAVVGADGGEGFAARAHDRL